MQNFTKMWNLKRAPSYLVCGPYWSKYNDYYQKWDRWNHTRIWHIVHHQDQFFYVDSGSEVRIPIFCLWHPIWPTLCESTLWMINLATADVPTVITVSLTVRRLSYMYKVWIKRACIKSPSIACDGNPPVTCGDFDDISPIWREYHHQYHCAMHVTHHIWWV